MYPSLFVQECVSQNPRVDDIVLSFKKYVTHPGDSPQCPVTSPKKSSFQKTPHVDKTGDHNRMYMGVVLKWGPFSINL